MAKQHFSKKQNTPKQKEVFLFGRHPVSLALQNKRRVIKEIYALSGSLEKLKIPQHIPTRIVTREQLDSFVGKGAVHQGLVARCLPLEPYNEDEIIQSLSSKKHSLVVILDQVTDPHNVGAVLRSAAAFNANCVVIPQNSSPDETGTLAKSASGALELIPLIQAKNLVRFIEKLKKIGFWCIGLDGYANHSIYQTKLPAKCIIVMGSEGDGLRRLTAENCDDTVKLPMNPNVESLNVSNACAITLYEWNRQHADSL